MIRQPRNVFRACSVIALLAALGCDSNSTPQSNQTEGGTVVASTVPEAAKERAIAAKDALFAKLSGRLMEVMQADGPVKAIEVCSQEANEIAKTVSEEQGVRIGRTSMKLRNPKNQPPKWAKKLFSEKPHEPQFEQLDEETVGALLPIKLQAKCLMCHGTKETLVPGVPEQLAKLYPEDQATGYTEGNLRGWFWVEVPTASYKAGDAVEESDARDTTEDPKETSALIQYGKMREVIGQKQHQGRVALADVEKLQHFYAVGAMEGLSGEVTVLDSQAVATRVESKDQILPIEDPEVQATMLIGRSVAKWDEYQVDADVPADEFDDYLAKLAKDNDIDLSSPTIFTVEGEFSDCCFHVINGACPVHAEMHGVEMAENDRPYKTVQPTIRGTLVGVYALNAAGVITHPGTTTHTHIVFSRPGSTQQLTGHVESAGIVSGSVLRFAKK